ncbi:MAG: hypothetical protein ABW116_09930 [Candidatus Sedimenticola sp. 20ELBAFRAG]
MSGINRNQPRWIVGEDPFAENDEIGFLVHNREPGFIACWTFGAPPVKPGHIAYIDDDQGDAVHLFDIRWLDPEPGGDGFTILMNEAVKALDQWLENNSEPLDQHQH